MNPERRPISSRNHKRTPGIWLGLIALVAGVLPAPAADVDGWDQVPDILARIVAPTFPERDFVATVFGAIADDLVDDGAALQQAIDACHAAGGGRVIVPAGIWRTGPLHLKSNVNLHVMEGATLLFDPDQARYPNVLTLFEGVECMSFSPLVYAFEQENIAVTGAGVLDGSASETQWWDRKRPPTPQKADVQRLYAMAEQGVPVEQRAFGLGSFLRPSFIQPYRCRNVLIEGVTLRRAPMWNIHPVLSTNVTVRRVTVDTHGPNNDGCNPESCRDVLIEDCFFNTGDDCIAIKSGRNADGRRVGVPSENIIVRNCTMRDGHGGVVIGSEISGDCRNVFVENCTMDSAALGSALRFKSNTYRGGTIENVYLRNVSIPKVSGAIVLMQLKYQRETGPHAPIIRNVHLDNVTSLSSRHVLNLGGVEGGLIDGVYVRNSTFSGVRAPDIIEHVRDVRFTNVTILAETDAAKPAAAALGQR